MRKLALVLGAICSVCSFSQSIYCEPVLAQQDAFASGVKLFTGGNYQGAIAYFAKALASDPNKADTYYYLASCYHRTGDSDKALKLYQLCVKKFPGSTAAQYSIRAMGGGQSAGGRSSGYGSGGNVGSAGGGVRQSGSSGNSGSRYSYGGNGDYIPDEESVGFQSDSAGHPVIRAQINNHPAELVFDTGADTTLIGKNMAPSLGLTVPSGPHTVSIQAAGGSTVGAWSVPSVVQVGKIKRTVEVVILDRDYPYASLGQSFFSDLIYRVDNNAHMIRFARKDKASNIGQVAGYGLEVPFKSDGRSMIVELKLNGKAIPAVFDSGAESTVRIGLNHLRHLGIEPPVDVVKGLGGGFGGATQLNRFKINRVELGGLIRNNVDIYAEVDGSMKYPIVGRGFFGDRTFSVDAERQVIKFSR
jgi:clan AA aspartic protease (TIGR02281 family)